MQEDNTTVIAQINPDLFVPPHVLPTLMELFGGDRQQALSPQEQLLAHLVVCHYCRTALVVLLNVAQGYDHRNNDPAEPTRDLLNRFAGIELEIEVREARAFERMGVYAEAVVADGWERAAKRFPDLASHLNMCPDCRSALEATVSFLAQEEENS